MGGIVQQPLGVRMEHVVEGGFIYRKQGGEIHRRPVDTAGLSAFQAAWLVLDHGEEVPPDVQKLTSTKHTEMRFD